MIKLFIKKIFKQFGVELISKYQTSRSDVIFHLKKLLKPNQECQIFDVGAATGEFSIKFNYLFPGSIIHSFEPQPNFFEVLKQNSKANWKVNNCVLSDKEGYFDFFITSGKESSSLIKPVKTNSGWDEYLEVSDEIKVHSETLYNYCQKNGVRRINLLKLDVQGSELSILKGAEPLLINQNIDIIYCEVLFMRFYENQPLFYDISGYLDKFDYKLYNIYNSVYTNNSILTWADAVFISNSLYTKNL
jgi:FkbM family methyltransferase